MKLAASLLTASCFSALALVSSAARADRYIDTFATPLPNQALPGGAGTIPGLWVGSLYGETRTSDSAPKPGDPTYASGTLGHRRDATLSTTDTSSLTFLTSTESSGKKALSYASGPGYSGVMTLEYGATADLNVNLVEDGSVAFEVEIEGDMDNGASPRPVQLTITLESSSGGGPATHTVTLLADGVYQIPFAPFLAQGIDLTDVDYISFDFDAGASQAVDYDLIGGLRTTTCLQALGSAIADVWIDRYEAPFPPRNLPGAGDSPILWVGTLNGTTKSTDPASQLGLWGVLGGQRYSVLSASDLNNFVYATMTEWDATPSLSYATGIGTSGSLLMRYGYSSPLNANLTAATAFELEVNGDMNDGASPRPVPLSITVTSNTGSKAAKVATATVQLLDDGMVYVPFSSFPNINFNDVDRVQLNFNASGVSAVDFDMIGGLRATACVPSP